MSNDEDRVEVDAIVVGGGPAGCTAAYCMAKEGLEVILIERGEYAGSKNVSGLLYGSVLNDIMPGFYEGAPVERPVAKRSFVFLDKDAHTLLDFGTQKWSVPPYNNTFVVYRSQFDRWYATIAEEAGASLLDGTVVDNLLYEGDGEEKKVIGVEVRGEEVFYCDCVVLADGANAMVSEAAVQELGISRGRIPQEYGLGVKEVIGLPREKIEDRFHLEKGEGAALEFVGSPFEGLMGGGFIYTAKESLSIGFLVKLESLIAVGASPNDVISGFKNHPYVRGYLKEGELLEYSAHLIPEGGYQAVGGLSDNGLLITGDAAGLVNASLYHEGSNLAMASGREAAKLLIEAKRQGNFSKSFLGQYEKRLRKSFVLEDLWAYRDLPKIHKWLPDLLSLYPRKICNLLIAFYRNSQEPKKRIQKEAIKGFFEGLSKVRMVRDLIRARKIL